MIMKRGICLIMATIMLSLSLLAGFGSVLVLAEDVTPSADLTFSGDTLDFSCRLDTETHKIHLTGLIRHDVFVTHRDYTVAVYAIPPGQNAEDIIRDPNVAPVAGSALSVKFEFVLAVKSIADQYSRYCIVLCSPNGEKLLASDPKFAEVASTFSFQSGDRSSYKGMATSQVSTAADAGSGRVIIPVHLECFLSQSSGGYVYQTEMGNLYFEKSQVESLDIAVRSATVAGATVYLQYLWMADGEKNIPNVYELSVLSAIEGLTTFLCERYKGGGNGRLDGIVVGESIDLLAKGVCEQTGLSLSAYTEKYALYAITVANAARRLRAETDIVLPFSSVNAYGTTDMPDAYAPTLVLEEILSILDKGFSAPFVCTTLIESRALPLQYPDGWETYQVPLQPTDNDEHLHAGNLESYVQYLKNLKTRFDGAPESFMFVWQIPDGLTGNALTATYSYSYFCLIAQDMLSSFVVSFTEREALGYNRDFDVLAHLYTYVDTEDGFDVCRPLLEFFDFNSWVKIHCAPYNGPYTLYTRYRTMPSLHAPNGVQGSFMYFDFSTSVNLNTWFVGNACDGIRLNYHKSGGKALEMKMTADNGGVSEAFCLYEYPENLVYTPYVAFRVGVDAADGMTLGTQLYEIVLSTGTGRTSIVGSAVAYAGETVTLVLDLSAYVGNHMSEYLKIGVRPLNGQNGDYSLWIYDIVGLSTEWSSEELEDLIAAERLRIRNLSNDDDEIDKKNERLWTIVGILVVMVMVGIGLFIFLRPTDEHGRKNRPDRTRDDHTS